MSLLRCRPASPSGAASLRRRRAPRPLLAACAALAGALALPACGPDTPQDEVVVYCALDLEFSDVIQRDFTGSTGIAVKLVVDNEITKTVGLTHQIKLEKDNPKADVFWNNEIVNTIRLKEYGCLEPYQSPSAADIPAEWKDPAHYWTGFAARARVFIVHREKCPKQLVPASYRDYLDPARKGLFAIAKPIAGTTATHLAVLFDVLGEEEAKAWWTGLRANGAALLTGNAHVMRAVRAGEIACGLTDTDDFRVAELDGYPVERVIPDQGEGELGCLLIPNTISLVKGGPRPDLGKRFIDYVLSREVERKLAFGPSAQVPLRADVDAPPHVPRVSAIKVMKVDFERAASRFDAAQEWLTRPGPSGSAPLEGGPSGG